MHVVIKGTIYAEQGEDGAEFREGDSFSWNACTPHIVKNIGQDTAIVLISIYTESENRPELL
ncbi:Cupin domain protein [compost metagenome]